MCAEKIQRLLMAFLLLVSMYLISIMSIWGLVLQGFIIFMIVVWAITDFCPSIWMFRKMFGECKK